MQAPRDRRIGLVILGLLAVVLAGLVIRRPEPPVDLAVYLRAGSQFATGGGLYEPGWGSPLDFPLPYTYPPVLAAAFAPVGWIPWRDAATLWTIANVALPPCTTGTVPLGCGTTVANAATFAQAGLMACGTHCYIGPRLKGSVAALEIFPQH